MRHHRWLPVVLLVVLARSSPVISEEWTRFRGPNGSGVSRATAVPIQWTDKDYHWKIQLPGVGHSSPVVDEKCVYVTWGASDQLVLLALDHDGHDRWRRNLGTFGCGHGSAISPILCGDLLVLANDDRVNAFLVAVDRATGTTRWRIDRRSAKASYATPCIFKPKDGPEQLIFGSTAEGLAGVDPATGTVNWQISELPRNTPSTRWISSPTTAHGLVIATYAVGSHGLEVIAVRPGCKAAHTAPRMEYTIETCVPSVPCPLVNGDLLFLCTNDGVLSCHRVLTGERLWSERLDGDFYASPICVNDRLYCISKQGEVFVLAASEAFELLARNSLGEKTYATPAIAGGRMYLRTDSHLMSLGGK